jgi:asparagine synthase (glutamine-hydrolysing)
VCGILTTINHSFTLADQALVNMKHRGPDAQGKFSYRNLLMGHLRLSIQDLSESANQPMFAEEERFVIVFNGEIYNHWDIRQNELSNITFKTSSDTETILELFIKYKEKCLNYLNGIFAFVIFDKVEETLFIARDHFGVKPFYYSLVGDQFACASELKGLLPYLNDKSIDLDSIQDYLSYMWCPGEGTPFKAVSKLLAGSYLFIDINNPGKAKPVRYYQLQFPEKPTLNQPLDLWINQLEEKLINAVKRQLLSDVPVGFFLSGGLDSSLLVAIAKRLLPDQKLRCYTIDSGKSRDGFSSDLFYARKVAEYLDVELVEIKVSSNFVSNFDNIIWFMDEPQSDPAPFNAFEISKVAREDGIKVLIGGTAGDDIFSGYRRHQALILDHYFEHIPVSIRKSIRHLIHNISSTKPIVRRLKKLTKSIEKSKNKRLVGLFEWQDFEFVKSIFKKELQKNLSEENQYFITLLEEVKHVEDDLNKLLYLEIYTFLLDHNLNYTDKAGMANSVEIRVPYLDIELVEFTTTIPVKYKMNGSQTKYILRKVAERYLPKDVIYRSKTGFGVPLEYWVRNEMDEFIESRLNPSEINKFSIFDSDVVSEIIKDNKSGKINASYNVWSMLAVQSWLKQFVGSTNE